MTDDTLERRKPNDHEKRLSTLEQSHANVDKSMTNVIQKLDLIITQINKVAILEERNSTQQTDINRAHQKIHKLEEKHEVFSKEVNEFINLVRGMARMSWVLWSVLGATVCMLLVKVLFFASSHGMTP